MTDDPKKSELRICLICRKPEQIEGLLPICAKCESQEPEENRPWEAEHERRQDEQREARNQRRWEAICPPEFRNSIRSKLPEKASELFDDVQKYNWRGRRGMTFCGPSGRGKSRIAFMALKASFERGARVKVIYSAEMRIALGSSWGAAERILNAACAVNVLLFDDIGQGAKLEQLDELTLAILDKRTREGKPTIATTQWSPEKIAERFARPETGAAIARRLGKDYSATIFF